VLRARVRARAVHEEGAEPDDGPGGDLERAHGLDGERSGIGEEPRGVGGVTTDGTVAVRAGEHAQRSVVRGGVVEEHDCGDHVLRRRAEFNRTRGAENQPPINTVRR